MAYATDVGGGGQPRWLVMNPMLGGRFQIAGGDAPVPATEVFTLRVEGKQELRYLDFRDMGRIYWVSDCSRDVPAWDGQGPEADSVGQMGLDVVRKRLRRFRDELKDLLRNQEFLAGIGNAYSDEILFEARLLPLRRRASLKPDEEEALYVAIPLVLSRAVEAILANPNYEESKQDRTFMAVHMKGGKTCPRCGHPLTLRTNWRAAARISSSVATTSAWRRVLMLRHMVNNDSQDQPSRGGGSPGSPAGARRVGSRPDRFSTSLASRS